ncbi:sensor histidine kinase [Roseomonas xinghualingensis]|uniref:sensor histidine kinase n=1 Tax=Roseomonas xinghualingensis TaxID=2986475 RepID=UPI0021F22C25|nr:histidine kinase dimerization/phosphoacceptor domain -containing protein [Roseomonas sp. SXEYE001]MCV4205884.1 GAF domain-containing protein [Roseomonas sp. SXEYE001]
MPMNVPEIPAEEQLARLRRQVEALGDFGRMAADGGDPEQLPQLACVQAVRGLGIQRAKLMRYRPETADLLIVAGVGWKQGVVGHVSLGADLASPAGQALRTRTPNLIGDASHDREFRYAPALREHGIISLVNVPVVVDGDVWGVLEVDSEAPFSFGPDDVHFLLALGSMLGLALRGRTRMEEGIGAAGHARLLAQERMWRSELQHRSKNDLQLIMALLVMQRRRLADDEGRRVLGHVLDRVSAIGVAQDLLSLDRGVGRIDLAEYLRALCNNLSERREGVAIETQVEPVELPHARAVPLGLIVNELVTNALKHAFPDGRRGTIRVEFAVPPGGEARLCVRDDGVGMGPPRPGSSGMELVRRLVQQIGGRTAQVEQGHGAGLCVFFPLTA